MASNSKLRRVCLYGGPGSGKTTLAAGLFSEFKKLCVEKKINRQLELCSEFVKEWAWEGRTPQGFDQVFLFAQQQRKEEIPLRSGVDHIFTDSPLFLNAAYARKYHSKLFQPLVTLAELHESQYPGLHIFLERGNRPYVAHGRYEDEENARRMDDYIRSLLDLYVGSNNYISIPYGNRESLLDLISDKLQISNKIVDFHDMEADVDENSLNNKMNKPREDKRLEFGGQSNWS